ncbi:MAG: hypothetical protein AAGB51_14215 [Planctomycetota bacterium]
MTDISDAKSEAGRTADVDHFVGLHKFYFDFLVKAAGFTLAVHGGLAAAFVGKISDPSAVRYMASAQVLFAIAFVWFFARGRVKLVELDRWIAAGFLASNCEWRVHSEMLPKMALLFAGLNLLAGVFGVIGLIKPEILAGG